MLTHWGRVTHLCLNKLIIIGSNNGVSPVRRQAIIWINAGILLFEPLGTNFSEFLIEILTFAFKKMCLKVSSAKWRPFCLGLDVLSNGVCWFQRQGLQTTLMEQTQVTILLFTQVPAINTPGFTNLVGQMGPISIKEIGYKIGAWISDRTHYSLWNVITHPSTKFSSLI